MEPTAALHNPLARDLEWVISSPPIIQGIRQQKNWTEAPFWQQQADEFRPQLQQLDSKPDQLDELLQQQRDYRLGHRFETLLAFWFQHNPRYQIIAQNLQVHEAHKTIGEFDFIIKDQLRNKIQHWEVACKFYLGLGNTRRRENWLGPMLKDRLNLKFDSMQQRQSSLSERPAAQQLLQQHGLHIDESICLMKGRLFYPIKHAPSPAPKQTSSNHQRGWWARPNEFITHYETQNLQWRPLTKNQWLAPQQNDRANINYSAHEILQQFISNPQKNPLCIVGFAADGSPSKELERVFLVAKDWAKSLNIVDNGSPNQPVIRDQL